MNNGVGREHQECIVGIDIGSSNVVMAVGYKQDNGLLDVVGVEIQSVGDSVKDGAIENVIELGNAIAKAKSELERELNISLREACVGISGNSVYGARYEDFVYINSNNKLITADDVRDLTERIRKISTNNEDEIIERVLQRYVVDDRQEVKSPVGAFGSKLSAEYLLVLCNKRQLERVKQALYTADIKFSALCVNPMVQPMALLSDEEKEEGVAIIDIGCDLTDISVVRQGKVCYFASLPIGASTINSDLSQFISASKQTIEKLKKRYGEAIAENISLDATCSVELLGRSRKQILQRNIGEIIEERLKDIARFALKSLKTAKLSSKIPCGVILTGGSAYLSNIEELFAREMNMGVRLASSLYGVTDNSKEMLLTYTQSTVLGVMLHGMQHNSFVAHPTQRATPQPMINRSREEAPVQMPIPQSLAEAPQRVVPQQTAPQPEPAKVEPTPKAEEEQKNEEQRVESPKKSKKPKRGVFDTLNNFLDRLISGDRDNDYLE